MLATHTYAGLLHPGSLLYSGRIIDDCFQMPAIARDCLSVLHLGVSQTDGRNG